MPYKYLSSLVSTMYLIRSIFGVFATVLGMYILYGAAFYMASTASSVGTLFQNIAGWLSYLASWAVIAWLLEMGTCAVGHALTILPILGTLFPGTAPVAAIAAPVQAVHFSAYTYQCIAAALAGFGSIFTCCKK